MDNDNFDKTSADQSQLGFEYQDLVCMEYLLKLQPGEEVGLEVMDDVHHGRIDNSISLVQVKHSVIDGNLTNLSIDLWKTLKIWCESLDSIGDKSIEFVLYTNKEITKQDGLAKMLYERKSSFEELKKEISNVKEKIDNKEKLKEEDKSENPIKKYVDYLYSVSDEILENVLGSVEIKVSKSDILARIENQLRYFAIPKEKISDALRFSVGNFKVEKYKAVKRGKKINITFEDFRSVYQFNRTVQNFASTTVDFSRYSEFKKVGDIDPVKGLFAKQLLDIEIDEDEILDYSIDYAATMIFIQNMISAGDFSYKEDRSFDDEVEESWKNIFRNTYNRQKLDRSGGDLDWARICLYDFLEANVEVSGVKLLRGMLKGKGMKLSDKPIIGWKKDWKKIYGDKK